MESAAGAAVQEAASAAAEAQEVGWAAAMEEAGREEAATAEVDLA